MLPETATLIANLEKNVYPNMAEDDLRMLVRRVAERASDTDLRAFLKSLLPTDKSDDAYVINILAAGMFGIVPGSKYMAPAGDSASPRVNQFLHRLRKSMLACSLLASKLRENSTKYIFYPEFLTFEWNTIRLRVAAVAKAHAPMGPSDDELTVLYSLGGYFMLEEAAKAVLVTGPKNDGGTTCIMTARAIYHASGLNMIGQRPPTVNTPAATMDLCVPMTKATKNGKNIDVATVQRDDINTFGRVFNDLKDPLPPIDTGDIYLIDGHGEHRFLLRGGAFAAHVGIVVNHTGMSFTTVDGGSGRGASISTNPRKLTHKDNVGWTFGDSRSYTGKQNGDIDEFMQPFMESNDKVLEWLRTTKGQEKNYKAVMDTKKKYDDAVAAGKTDLAKLLKKPFDMQMDQYRRLIKFGQGNVTGEVRTIHGWWRPEQYTGLDYAGTDSIRRWVN